MTPCPKGKYLDASFGSLSTNCKLCIPGYVCPTTGIATPTILCTAGNYCDAGTDDGTTTPPVICPIGSYCPTGSEMPI